MTLQELKDKMNEGVTLINLLDTKYTKANSKRLRAVLNDIQKNAVKVKKDLVATDKAQ